MSKKTWMAITAVVILGAGALGAYALNGSNRQPERTQVIQSHRTYSLNLLSGKNYSTSQPAKLSFVVQDENAHILKTFDTVHEKKLHLIVIRKDRTNFQHVHPTYDENSGKFVLADFRFPTDGSYRIYADFTPADSQKDSMGMKLSATPYQDVTVGSLNKYAPQGTGSDKLASSANGIDTNIFFAPSEDSPGGSPNKDFYAGRETTLAVQVSKNGQPFKSLQTYLGALGHMVVIGPNLEYIHAHTSTEDVQNQTGLIIFVVYFPEAGQYKMFLQTQSNNLVNTTGFTVTVKADPAAASDENSMQGGMYMGH